MVRTLTDHTQNSEEVPLSHCTDEKIEALRGSHLLKATQQQVQSSFPTHDIHPPEGEGIFWKDSTKPSVKKCD